MGGKRIGKQCVTQSKKFKKIFSRERGNIIQGNRICPGGRRNKF